MKILDLTGLESGKPYVGLRSPSGPPAEEYVPLGDALEEGRISADDVRSYLCRKRQQGVLPVPGEVDVIVGGPPCQGVSDGQTWLLRSEWVFWFSAERKEQERGHLGHLLLPEKLRDQELRAGRGVLQAQIRRSGEHRREIIPHRDSLSAHDLAQESMAREEGLYMRFAALNLVKLGYQLRMGILSAACYGAPQVQSDRRGTQLDASRMGRCGFGHS